MLNAIQQGLIGFSIGFVTCAAATIIWMKYFLIPKYKRRIDRAKIKGDLDK